jgi:site-specific DNA recombinase
MIMDPNCKNKNWRMEELDELVFGEIRKLKLEPEIIERAKTDKLKQSDEPNKVDILKKEIDNINQQISRFMDLYGIGKFTIEQVTSKTDPLNEQRAALEKELASITGSVGELTTEDAIELINSFDEVLKYGDFHEIRLIIESLIYYIELDGENVIIHWRFA